MRRTEVVTGTVVALVGVGALVMALRLALFTAAGVPGPGFFPALVSAALVVFGLALAGSGLRPAPVEVRAVGAVADVEAAPDPQGPADEQVGRHPMLRSGLVWVVYAASVPLLGLVGFVPTTVVLMAVLLLVVERRRGWVPVLAAVAVPAAVYELFVPVLGIALPTGLLGGLGVLGL